MLVWYNIVFVFGVYGLVVLWDVDFVGFELGGTEIFEEVGVPGTVEVDVGMVHVFGLGERC